MNYKSKTSYKWIVLSAYLLVTGLSQMLWLNFAPLITSIEKIYGVSESTASLLILVFPLIYVILSIPSGSLIDSKGYKFAVGLGAIVMSLFACLRIYVDSFWVLVVAQTGIAVAQPFIVNGISKLVLDWFDEDQAAIATGLGTMGMFLGMIVGLVATPLLVDAFGLRQAMGVFAAVCVLSTVIFYVFVKEGNRAPDLEMAKSSGYKSLLLNRDLMIIFIISFLGLGFFNGFTTWLEPIFAPNGIDSVQAGSVGGILIFGGIIGAVVIPLFSDWLGKRKPFLIGSILLSLCLLYPLCETKDFILALTLSGILGFFFLPAFALLLEMCSELAGSAQAGSATALLMLAGNAGGVVVVLAMDWVKGDNPTFQAAIYLLLGVLALSALFAFMTKETAKGKTVYRS